MDGGGPLGSLGVAPSTLVTSVFLILLVYAIVVDVTHSVKRIPTVRLFDLATEPGKWPLSCFNAALKWFRDLDPMLRLSAPFGLRTFVLISDAAALEHVLVKHASSYGKRHAHGVLERFRTTKLPVAGVEAWPIVHRLTAQLAGDLGRDVQFAARLVALVRSVVSTAMPLRPPSPPTSITHARTRDGDGDSDNVMVTELSDPIREVWWCVVLLVVLGIDDPKSAALYAEAWSACIDRLDTPAVFLFRIAQLWPSARNRNYWRGCAALRALVRRHVDAALHDPETVPKWCALHRLCCSPSRSGGSAHSVAPSDAVEILLELCFTGASSVTTTMIWALHHLAQPEATDVQRAVQGQARAAFAAALGRGEKEEGPRPLTLGAVGEGVPALDSVLRETLRLYSPIHIGRVALEDDHVPCRGTVHHLPRGTDVAANYWFLHRDPSYWPRADEFVPSRWDGVAPNAHGAHYGPFSKGMRGCPGQRVAFVLMKAALATILGERELRASMPSDGCPHPRFKQSVVLPNQPEHVHVRYSRVAEEVVPAPEREAAA